MGQATGDRLAPYEAPVRRIYTRVTMDPFPAKTIGG